jgi:hypothetical protein
MITILCCYNNYELLNKMLLPSLDKQTSDFNIILIDTKKHSFSSAAEAYNEVLKFPSKYSENKVGDILVFIHQDIFFNNNNLLELVENEILLKPMDIFGFAGITNKGIVYSNLKYLDKSSFIVRNQISSILEVESVDECFFACSKKLWDEIKFDYKHCFHWHLYAVDFCYSARTKFQNKSYVLPYLVYHKEDSKFGLETDNYFLRTLWRIANKHKKYKIIFAPCYIVKTQKIYLIIKLAKTFIKNIIN